MKSLTHIVALLLLASSTKAVEIRCFERGECTDSTSVAEVALDTVEQCVSACQKDVYCNDFTFDEAESLCSLWVKCENFSEECETCVSGSKGCALTECDSNVLCSEATVLATTHTDNIVECKEKCLATTLCSYYEYAESEGDCALLRNCPDYFDFEGIVTNSIFCELETELCFQPFRCIGVLVESLPTDDVDDCVDTCLDDPACEWFVFEKEDDVCSLYETCEPVDCETCVAGSRDCADDDDDDDDDESNKLNVLVHNEGSSFSFLALSEDADVPSDPRELPSELNIEDVTLICASKQAIVVFCNPYKCFHYDPREDKWGTRATESDFLIDVYSTCAPWGEDAVLISGLGTAQNKLLKASVKDTPAKLDQNGPEILENIYFGNCHVAIDDKRHYFGLVTFNGTEYEQGHIVDLDDLEAKELNDDFRVYNAACTHYTSNQGNYVVFAGGVDPNGNEVQQVVGLELESLEYRATALPADLKTLSVAGTEDGLLMLAGWSEENSEYRVYQYLQNDNWKLVLQDRLNGFAIPFAIAI